MMRAHRVGAMLLCTLYAGCGWLSATSEPDSGTSTPAINDAPPPTGAPGSGPATAPTTRSRRSPDCAEGVLGVLSGLPGLSPAGTDPVHPGPVTVYARPDGPQVAVWGADGTLTADGATVCKGGFGDNACVMLPYGYQAIGVPVYAVRGDWVQIPVGSGGSALTAGDACEARAWLERTDPLQVLRLGPVLGGGSHPYPLEGWDRHLHPVPGATGRALEARGEVHFEVHGNRTDNGRVWLDVEVFSGPSCAGGTSVDRGWTPATDGKGRLVVWFFTDC